MNNLKKEKYKIQAAYELKDHKYTCIIDDRYIEAWRCQEPGTINYAFDITITRFGISIVGDLGGFTFNVGSYYGIPFLAGRDVTYYILQKLSHKCKPRVYDQEAFEETVCREIFYLFEDIFYEEKKENEWLLEKNPNIEIPNFIFDDQEITEHPDELLKFINKVYGSLSDDDENYNLFHDLYYNFFNGQIPTMNNEYEAADFLCDAFKNIDMCDLSITKVDDSIISRLFIFNHAAKQIMKIKDAEWMKNNCKYMVHYRMMMKIIIFFMIYIIIFLMVKYQL